MPTPVKHSSLAILGLLVIAFLCVQMLRHAITLPAAAGRAVVTVLVLAIVDRLVMPVAAALVSTPGRERPREEGSGRLSLGPPSVGNPEEGP